MALNFITTLDTFDQNVTEHSRLNIADTWLDPNHVASKILLMNNNKKIMKEENKKLDQLNELISKLAVQENPDQSKLSALIKLRDAKYNMLTGMELAYNKDFEEAKKYIKVYPKRNGMLLALFITDKDAGYNPPQTFKVSSVSSIPSGIAVHPKQQYMYDTSTANSIHSIVSAAKAGNWNDLTDDKFTNLFSAGFNIQGDAYNKLAEAIVDARFQYNIKRSFNEQLVDIRNIKNFRSSNIHTDAQLKDVSTAGNNFINPATTDGTNASKSFYMSRNDFYWSLNFNELKNEKNTIERQSIQNIILNEYQPNIQYDMGRLVFKGLDDVAGGVAKEGVNAALDAIGMGGMAGLFKAAGQHLVEKLYNDKLDEIGARPEKLYNEEHYEDFTNPMYYVEHLFNNGRWLNTYLLPFISDGKVKTEYLANSSDPGTWDIGGLTDGLGLNSLMQTVIGLKISLSLPTSPVFSLNNSHNNTMRGFEISFFLINKDDHYLEKNFQFMQALFAGTQWLAMEFGAVVATNVYHVLVPGRFIIQWASLTSNFQAMGKLRTNEYMYATYNGKIGMIDSDTLWPLAWSVSLSITPLSPWNFNTHMAYYLNGFGAAQRERLAKMKTSWMNTMKTLENEKNEIENMKQRKNQIKEALGRQKGVIFDTMNAIDDAMKRGDMDEVKRLTELLKKQRKDYYDIFEEAKTMEYEINEAMYDAGLGDWDTLLSQNVTNQISEHSLKAVDEAIASRANGWGGSGNQFKLIGKNSEEAREAVQQAMEDSAAVAGAAPPTVENVERWDDKSGMEKIGTAIGEVVYGDNKEYSSRNVMQERRLEDQNTVNAAYAAGAITAEERDEYMHDIKMRRVEESEQRQLAAATTLEEKQQVLANSQREKDKLNTERNYQILMGAGRNLQADSAAGNVGLTNEQIAAKNLHLASFDKQSDLLYKEYNATDMSDEEYERKNSEIRSARIDAEYKYKVEGIRNDFTLSLLQKNLRLAAAKLQYVDKQVAEQEYFTGQDVDDKTKQSIIAQSLKLALPPQYFSTDTNLEQEQMDGNK